MEVTNKMINVYKDQWSLSIYEQLKIYREAKLHGGLVALSPELYQFAKNNNLNIDRQSKIKKYLWWNNIKTRYEYKQEELFNEWNQKCSNLKVLKSFIQNDFNKMLSDGFITKKELLNAQKDFNKLFTNNMIEFNKLVTNINDLIDDVIQKSKELD
jgi:hypothetical protein